MGHGYYSSHHGERHRSNHHRRDASEERYRSNKKNKKYVVDDEEQRQPQPVSNEPTWSGPIMHITGKFQYHLLKYPNGQVVRNANGTPVCHIVGRAAYDDYGGHTFGQSQYEIPRYPTTGASMAFNSGGFTGDMDHSVVETPSAVSYASTSTSDHSSHRNEPKREKAKRVTWGDEERDINLVYVDPAALQRRRAKVETWLHQGEHLLGIARD